MRIPRRWRGLRSGRSRIRRWIERDERGRGVGIEWNENKRNKHNMNVCTIFLKCKTAWKLRNSGVQLDCHKPCTSHVIARGQFFNTLSTMYLPVLSYSQNQKHTCARAYHHHIISLNLAFSASPPKMTSILFRPRAVISSRVRLKFCCRSLHSLERVLSKTPTSSVYGGDIS